jgi:hypothetical protein
VSPISLPILFLINAIIVFYFNGTFFYQLLFSLQFIFYTMALIGWLMYKSGKKSVFFFTPFYFVFMNGCMLLGFIKQMYQPQKGTWEKAQRAPIFTTDTIL